LPVYKSKKKAERKGKENKQVVVLHPHIIQAEELALVLNVNLVEGILVFSSSSDPQHLHCC